MLIFPFLHPGVTRKSQRKLLVTLGSQLFQLISVHTSPHKKSWTTVRQYLILPLSGISRCPLSFQTSGTPENLQLFSTTFSQGGQYENPRSLLATIRGNKLEGLRGTIYQDQQRTSRIPEKGQIDNYRCDDYLFL